MVAATKNEFVVPNFVAATNPFFFVIEIKLEGFKQGSDMIAISVRQAAETTGTCRDFRH